MWLEVSSGLEAKSACVDGGLFEAMPSSDGVTGVAEVERESSGRDGQRKIYISGSSKVKHDLRLPVSTAQNETLLRSTYS